MKWLIIFFALVSFVLFPFLFFGDFFENLFSETGSVEWIQSFENVGWLIGILLLVADIFLPLPGTIIMAALGYIYGPFLGGLLAFLGSFLSGLTAYFLCRIYGINFAIKIIGEEDYLKGKLLFYNQGGWFVALSRWLPILAEVSACMAGLAKMPKREFLIALICGSLPMGFLFAFFGYLGKEVTSLGLILNFVAPAILWFVASYLLRKREVVKNLH